MTDNQFISDLEKKHMSDWTREETVKYSRLTEQGKGELDNALYQLALTLNGGYARGEYFDYECVLEAIRLLNDRAIECPDCGTWYKKFHTCEEL